MSRFVTLLALASTALAVPSPADISAAAIGASLTSVLHTGSLSKRQSTSDALSGLTTLLSDAVQGQSSGECQSECESWIDLITACTENNVSNEDVGLCTCGAGPVQAMAPCGACFGADGSKAASDFDGVCSSFGFGSGGGDTSSSISSSRSAFASGVSSASRTLSSVLASETDAATTDDETSSATSTRETSASGGAVTVTAGGAAPTSGAARNVVGGLAGLVGVVGAMMV